MIKIISQLVKLSSVTFHVQGSHKIGQPQDTATIASNLWSWAAKHVPRYLISHRPEPIAIDGFEPDYTGIINWYVPIDVDPDEVSMYIEQFIQEEALPQGIKIVYALDQSKMFSIPVWRLKVIENLTQQRTKLPELNISNRNASVLLAALGIYSNDLYGEIDAHELLDRIQSAEEVELQEGATNIPTQVDDIGFDSLAIDIGLGSGDVLWYLNQLKQIAQVAINMNAPIVEYS